MQVSLSKFIFKCYQYSTHCHCISISLHFAVILLQVRAIFTFRCFGTMASSIPTRSFYKRTNLHTVIPGSSADSDGIDSGNEDLATLPPRADDAASDDDEYIPPGGNVITEDEVASSSSSDDESAPRQKTTAGNRRCASTPAWRKDELHVGDIKKNVTFSTPDEVGPALQYFKKLIDENIVQMIVDQSNLYSVQETGHSINRNCNEMAALISILLYTGLVKMSAFIDF